MAKKVAARRVARVSRGSRPKMPKQSGFDEQVLRKATGHLVRTQGMFYVATEIKEEHLPGSPLTWIISVHIRYPTGHEGYVGDLHYDGRTFAFLTEARVMQERATKIAEDPERNKKWNEHRTSAVPARAG